MSARDNHDASPSGSTPPQPEQAVPAAQRDKKRGNVRFMTTSEGEVVPERMRFERSSNNSRAKAQEALEYLLAGNERFRKGALERCNVAGEEVIAEMAGEVQKPTTVILACSDSRVPPELICDQGMGDCHVVRVAGNVVNDFVLGSVLFAMQHLGARLVVVIGHSRCSVVAQAVQRWARKKALDREKNPTVRTLAEGVQETLGSHGPTPPSQQTPPASNVPISPFQAEASKPPPQPEAKRSLLERLCGGCAGRPQGADNRGGVSGASTPMQTEGMGVHDNKRSVSNERHMTRGSIARSSINPLTLLVGAIGNAVEHVANSVEHSEGFRTLVHKENRLHDKSWDSDDEDLKKGLAKQDSLEFTRARLAKQREQRKIETLRQLAQRADVDSVIDENVKVSATTILKGLVKNMDAEVVQEIEVASAKYDIHTGRLSVMGRHWYTNHTYYNSIE